MPLYTFYPNRPDGSSSAFVALEMANDATAQDAAAGMLGEYASCVAVDIWLDDRLVATVRQNHPAEAVG